MLPFLVNKDEYTFRML